jgi:hypothetical protein
VLIDFIDGDPDRPIITGRVYSADKGPTNVPFPHPDIEKKNVVIRKPSGGTGAGAGDGGNDSATELPATVKTDLRYSGIKTWSVPFDTPDGKPDKTRYHLLRFDDTTSREQYLIRSQGRLDITAFNHRYENIGRDRNMTVGGKKITPPPKEIGGDYITKIFRHYHLHVGDPEFPTQSGNRTTLLEQSERLKIVKDSLLSIGGNWSTAVGGDYYLHVGSPSGGGNRTTILAMNDRLNVLGFLNQNISGAWTTDAGGQVTITASGAGVGGQIVLSATQTISLVVGSSQITITPGSITLDSPLVQASQSVVVPGTPVPPVPPITPIPPVVDDPDVPKPQEPTSADPGDKLNPPQWQS